MIASAESGESVFETDALTYTLQKDTECLIDVVAVNKQGSNQGTRNDLDPKISLLSQTFDSIKVQATSAQNSVGNPEIMYKKVSETEFNNSSNLTNLASNTQYEIKVQSRNIGGMLTSTTLKAWTNLPVVKQISLVSEDASVTRFQWQSLPGATSYEVIVS